MNYYFWIQSGRGTEQIQPITLPSDISKMERKSKLEDWCSHFGAWHVSGNCVAYGCVVSTPSVRKKVMSYYKAKSQESQKIDELIHKKITTEQYTRWANRNRKARMFPFK